MKYVASSISQMTDYDKYYVYTGHEEGMVTGCWYFWSGTEWLIGGDYQCGIDDIVEMDSSFTSETLPANAKAVGDMIVVSNTEPTSPNTELWIDPDTESVLVPTMDDIEGTYAKKSEVESTYARKAAIGSPLRAATASAMTDVTKIYVYTGSESGYTFGHWYHYNGSSWDDGGVYNSTAFVTDKTLTGDGEAADAKVTGDEITDLKSAIGNKSSLNTDTKTNLVSAINEVNGHFLGGIAEGVADWLDNHPEATTTVQDGSITSGKLSTALKDEMILFVSDATELASAISNGNEIIAFDSDTIIEISSMLTIPSGTTIIGNGAKFVRASGFDGKMISAEPNCNISNIKFDGNRSTVVDPSWDKTIEIALYGFCTLENCIFEHGNECVIAYGDCNRITHCKFTDCGGNAIHFSGGKYTVVDGCYVNGSNKKSGMGHENGCIIWSSECAYVTCVNNYCEDGISGFGRIGSVHAGYVKIIGNTVKNCQNACVVANTAVDTSPAREIVISGNIFINCIQIDLYKTLTQTCDIGRVTIANNNLVETSIIANRMTSTIISNNNLRGKTVQIVLNKCSSCIVVNNIVNNIANMTRAILVASSFSCSVVGNYVRGGKEAILCNDSINCSIDCNIISAYCPSDSDLGVSLPNNCIFRNNIVRTYGRGLNAGTGCLVIGNQFWLATNSTAIRIWGGTENAIVALNITNKTNSLAGTETGYVGNITGATDDVFTTVTLTLSNITSDGVTTAVLGDDYICTLTADSGYVLPDTITVTVNGITLYPSEYEYNSDTGTIEIYGIVGVVTITASGVSN